MQIGELSAGSNIEASVKVINSQRKQEEAVVGKLLESIAEMPRPDGKGQRLNVVA